MDKIYLIIRHGFDNWENHSPDYNEILGYAETEELAKQKIEELQSKTKYYQGWDKKTYPYFRIETVEHINKYKHDKPILRLWS